MRRFSSYGPINNKLHYYVPREEKKGIVAHDAAGLTRRSMKIIPSLTTIYCRGLIYQAQALLIHPRLYGFDESNPYDRMYVHFFFVFLCVTLWLIF